MEKVVAVSNELNLKVLHACRGSDQSGNIFFSPFSITSVLMMLYTGARTSTKEEMKTVLGIDLLDEGVFSLLKYLQKLQDSVLLKTVNILALDQHYEILAAFSNNLKTNYNTICQSLDFACCTGEAREKLNGLIESATNHVIKDFFTPDIVTTDTILILANAVYFKGSWEKTFNESNTVKHPFYANTKQATMVDMMYREDSYNYTESKDLDASFLEIPYLGYNLSMIVILPNKNDGLPSLEKELTVGKLKDTIKSMHSAKVSLSFPRFKLEEAIPLKECLMNLGIKEVFSATADLSGISGEREIFVSNALHKAVIEVTEEGTVAAAATAFAVNYCYSPHMYYFKADHPFMFLIQETTTGLILFTGSITTL